MHPFKPFRPITAWTPGIRVTTWTMSGVRSTLRAHAQGVFTQSAQLADTFLEDDEIPGVLAKRVDAVLGSAFGLGVPEGGNQGLAKRIAADLEPRWFSAFPESELDDLMRSYRMLGVGVGVLDWTQSATRWTPRVRHLPADYLRFDADTEQFVYSAREGEFVVTPGDGQWILLVDGRRGWLRASVRALAITWIAKCLNLRDWSRYNERHGLPIIKAKVPAFASDPDRDSFLEDLEQLGSEIVATLPTHLDESGAAFDLELLEAKDRSWESFERSVERCDRKFQIHFLGQNLTTEIAQGQGSRAAAEVHRGVERSKAKADAEKLATALREQAVLPWAAFNYAGATLDDTPWPEWDTAPAEDLKDDADAKKAFGDALSSFKAAGYKVSNLDELAKRYDVELEEAAEPAPEPAKPGPEGARVPPSGQKVALASGSALEGASGFIAGQGYADALVEHATAQATGLLREDVATVLEVLEQAQDYEDLRRLLHEKYRQMSPEKLSALVEKYLIISELAGRAAVIEDL